MDVKVEAQSPVSRLVAVTLPAESVAAGTNKRLREIGKTAKIQGFRPGKVPFPQLKRRYGKSARIDAIDRLVNESLASLLDRDDLNDTIHLSRPEVTSGFEGGDVTFTFVSETMPRLDPVDYTGVDVQQVKAEIDEAEIESRLQALRDEHTEIVPVEDRTTVNADDVVTVTYHGQGSDAAKEIHAHDQQIDLADPNLLAGFAEGLAGAEKGASVEVTITAPEDFPVEALQGQDVVLEVKIEEIKAKRVPELDDELAKETGDAETLEELTTQIRAELVEAASKANEGQARRQLIEKIVANNPTDLPPLYVEAQAQQETMGRLRQLMGQGLDIRQMGIDVQQMAAGLTGEVSQAIHESLVLRAIGDKEEIQVTDEDFDAFLAEQAEESGQPLPKLRARFRDAEQKDRAMVRLRFDRVLDFVWSKATIEWVDAPEDDAAGEEAAAPSGEETAEETADKVE